MPPTPATAPTPSLAARRAGRLLRLSWRSALGLLALLTVVACLATAAILVGFWALLSTIGKDLTLSNDTVKYWPKGLWSFDILQRYAWYYLAGAGAALFVVLPCALAILERLWFLGYRPRDNARGGTVPCAIRRRP